MQPSPNRCRIENTAGDTFESHPRKQIRGIFVSHNILECVFRNFVTYVGRLKTRTAFLVCTSDSQEVDPSVKCLGSRAPTFESLSGANSKHFHDSRTNTYFQSCIPPAYTLTYYVRTRVCPSSPESPRTSTADAHVAARGAHGPGRRGPRDICL